MPNLCVGNQLSSLRGINAYISANVHADIACVIPVGIFATVTDLSVCPCTRSRLDDQVSDSSDMDVTGISGSTLFAHAVTDLRRGTAVRSAED
jgi:hypothetical protein